MTPFKKIRTYFFSGVLLVAPISLTLYIVWWLVKTIDGFASKLFPDRLFQSIPVLSDIPGIGLFLSLLLLVLLGAITRGVLGRFIVSKGEAILNKLPLVRSIYGGLKQVFEAFFGQQALSFRQVGLIEYPRKGIWSLCFITGTTQGEVQEKTSDSVINVFVPTTPNPTSGFLLFIPKEDIRILDMRVEDGLKMVISAGIVTPPYIPHPPLNIPSKK